MRVERIKALNTENIIEVSRDNENEIIAIKFNFFIHKDITSIFELPEWAKCQDENFTGDAQAQLIPGNLEQRNRVVQTGVVIQIVEYNKLYISSGASGTYKGTIYYESTPTIDRGIILNGVRVHCLTPGTNEDITTMMSIVRNHEGNLIVSKTLDSSFKKIFNFSTVPLCNEEYEIDGNKFVHTLKEFLNILRGKTIGSWIYLVINGETYITILKDGTISSRDIKAEINNRSKLCKILSFTLEEV